MAEPTLCAKSGSVYNANSVMSGAQSAENKHLQRRQQLDCLRYTSARHIDALVGGNSAQATRQWHWRAPPVATRKR